MKIETAWHLEEAPSLQFSKFLVHVFKNDHKVCTHEVEEEDSFSIQNSYSATFLVPDVFEHKSKDLYDVCVEGVRKHDGIKVPSERKRVHHDSIQRCMSILLVNLRLMLCHNNIVNRAFFTLFWNNIHALCYCGRQAIVHTCPQNNYMYNPFLGRPNLDDVQIADDGATATATVFFESSLYDEATFDEQYYDLQMRFGFDPQVEWKSLPKSPATISASDPIPITSGRHNRGAFIALKSSVTTGSSSPTYEECRMPAPIRSISTDSTIAYRMSLTAILPIGNDRLSGATHFHVISKRPRTLSIPSRIVSFESLGEIGKFSEYNSVSMFVCVCIPGVCNAGFYPIHFVYLKIKLCSPRYCILS